MDNDSDIPKWDPALEALVYEAYQAKGQALDVNDLVHIAQSHRIRFHDLMTTMLELCANARWRYQEAGVVRMIFRREVDKLHGEGRLTAENLKAFSGTWRPLKNA